MLSAREITTLLLFKKREGNHFTCLPKDIIIQVIGGINVKNGFRYLLEADYIGLINLLDFKPSIMFKKVKIIVRDQERMMSLLQMALYILDYTAWNICYDACVNKSYKNEFIDQAKQVTDHIILDQLFSAYETYIRYFHDTELRKTNHLILHFAWMNVGLAQRDVLPLHMLKEMCTIYSTAGLLGEKFAVAAFTGIDKLDELSLEAIAIKHNINNVITPIYNKIDGIVNRTTFHRKMDLNRHKSKWISCDINNIPFSNLMLEPGLSQSLIFSPNDVRFHNCIDSLVNDSYGLWYKGEFCISKWDNRDAIILTQGVIFLNCHDDPCFPLITMYKDVKRKLGIEFTLARGGSAFTFSVNKAEGDHGMLGYKAADDLNNFRELYSRLLKERELFINSLDAKQEKLEGYSGIRKSL